ncbi:MAG: succinyl-diaminopimelate desuccinylase [Granulosicoccus sp.]
MSATIELLTTLVQRPSITPDDQGCQALIADRLAAVGFTLETMRFNQVDNLWARIGTSGPLFVFAGHTDVVPTGNEASWTHPPFSATLDQGLLFGRGAADMKAGVAAMVTACERFVLRGHTRHGSLAVLLTSDEEGPAIDGTARVIGALEARSEKIDWCVLGEPTSTKQLGDVIKNGRRGSLSATMTVRGIQGHVAYPHLADNPVHRLLPMLDELVSIEWDQGNEHFPPTTLQISNIHAGTGASNVIPADVVVDFNLRFGTASNSDDIQRRIESLCQTHKLDASIEWRLSAKPFLTRPGSLTDAMQTAIQSVAGIEARLETTGGTSDGRFIAPTGAQVVEFGPLNATIHQINECIDCADVDALSSIYELVLEQMLGNNGD